MLISTAGCIRLNLLFAYAGFYGRPWTMEQRKELFRRYNELLVYLSIQVDYINNIARLFELSY